MQIQHGIRTKLYDSKYYSEGSEASYMVRITIMGHMTQHKAYRQRKHNMSEYIQLQMKKAKKPDYLPDPAEGTRS